MPDDFPGNQQPQMWTSTKAVALFDVKSDVWLMKRGVQFCRLLEMKSDFFADNKKQHILRLTAKLDYKTSKEHYVYF